MQSLQHFLRLRDMIGTVRGAFILRADVELLQSDLSEWPTNKLCAPWKVPSALQQNAVNDALLYIPHSLFDDVRVASAARINQTTCNGWAMCSPKIFGSSTISSILWILHQGRTRCTAFVHARRALIPLASSCSTDWSIMQVVQYE